MGIIVKGSNIITKGDNIITNDPYAPIDGNEFTWDGVTYKVVVKDYGGSIGNLAWLDRNLGASRIATSSTDSQSYGDIYQWGRLTDGHEKRNSSISSTRSSSDVPGHSNFITHSSTPYDWRNPQNNNLWQGVEGDNNPSPPGWRIPTEEELNAERLSWSTNNSAGAYNSLLKFTVAGRRSRSNGELADEGTHGHYIVSNISSTNHRGLYIDASNSYFSDYSRARGASVRCVRTI
jgi:uncharacterized protein (TIGR02145 family)